MMSRRRLLDMAVALGIWPLLPTISKASKLPIVRVVLVHDPKYFNSRYYQMLTVGKTAQAAVAIYADLHWWWWREFDQTPTSWRQAVCDAAHTQICFCATGHYGLVEPDQFKESCRKKGIQLEVTREDRSRKLYG